MVGSRKKIAPKAKPSIENILDMPGAKNLLDSINSELRGRCLSCKKTRSVAKDYLQEALLGAKDPQELVNAYLTIARNRPGVLADLASLYSSYCSPLREVRCISGLPNYATLNSEENSEQTPSKPKLSITITTITYEMQ